MTRPMLTAALVALAAVAVLVAPRLTPPPQVRTVAAPVVPVVYHVVERQRPELIIPEATDRTAVPQAQRPAPRLALPEVADAPDLMDGCPPCGMG